MRKANGKDWTTSEGPSPLAIIKQSYDWDWSGAEREFKEAIALNPNYATAHHWYSHYLVAMGRLDEAVNELERARDLDPFSIPINDFLGTTLYYARRYDEALRQFRRASEMHPDRAEFHEDLANVYEQKKMFAEAFAERQQALTLNKETQTAAAARTGLPAFRVQRLSEEEDSVPGKVPATSTKIRCACSPSYSSRTCTPSSTTNFMPCPASNAPTTNATPGC